VDGTVVLERVVNQFDLSTVSHFVARKLCAIAKAVGVVRAGIFLDYSRIESDEARLGEVLGYCAVKGNHAILASQNFELTASARSHTAVLDVHDKLFQQLSCKRVVSATVGVFQVLINARARECHTTRTVLYAVS